MNINKTQIFEKVDKFFDTVIERANARRELLKNEYKAIEAKERRRLKSKQMKMERDLQELKTFATEFSEFLQEFDSEMDYLANKACVDG